MEIRLLDGDYVPDGLGGVERRSGEAALLQRVIYRLTAHRGQFPLRPERGSRLYLLGRESVPQRLSAARLYDLDFLPVCQEQYDLLIPASAWDTPMVKMLLEVMESEAFARRLQRLGGYTLEKPGQVRLRL